MNYFFGIESNDFSTKLTIPKFKNKNKIKEPMVLLEANIENDIWKVTKTKGHKEDQNFFFLDQNLLDNKKIFFLSTERDFENYYNKDFLRLENFNNYTNTNPAFRSNIQISNKIGAFSSYQSDYPFKMISNKGSILSSLSMLTNKSAEKNVLVLKNIYINPSHDRFYIYFIDYKKKEIILKHQIFTNQTNFIELSDKLLTNDTYLFSKEYLCIPLYISMSKKNISLEHTHPPHEYILSDNKYSKIKELKEKFNDIVN